MKQLNEEQLASVALQIAKKHLGVFTLETRNNDDLDFHSVSAEGIRRAITDAIKVGMMHSDHLLEYYIPNDLVRNKCSRVSVELTEDPDNIYYHVADDVMMTVRHPENRMVAQVDTLIISCDDHSITVVTDDYDFTSSKPIDVVA